MRPKFKNLKVILNIWKIRQLTLDGNILLIKTFGLSQFVYLASVITIPNEVILEVDKIFCMISCGKGGEVLSRGTHFSCFTRSLGI